MGIAGLWDQVRKTTPGEEVTLAQLAADCVREKGRPLRIAVDTPFAVFQYNEATRPVASYVNVSGVRTVGGMNHPTRTLYYHIQHLLRAGVQPLLIYDGPNKPRVKRHRHHRYSATYTPYEPRAASSLRTAEDIEREYDPQHVTHLSKQILDLLGIPWYVAPGEAEAECARLEQAGVVDAVLTKDGDAFVFGSNTILQRLDADNKVATVCRFLMEDLKKARPPLRQQDLLLLALMAGGDYHDGVRGAGPVAAVEAARVGYSGELKALLLANRPTKAWRDRLVHELRTNDRNRFTRTWVAAADAIPSTFPDPQIAQFYLNPAVSSREQFEEYGRSIDWHKETNTRGLRQWAAKYLDWKYAYHACKFVNNLAPALIARKLMINSETGVDGSSLIRAIHGEKPMAKQGGEPPDDDNEEPTLLRVSYYPATVINIDVSGEPVVEGYKANMEKLFDPKKEAREWFPMWMLEKGAPTIFREWRAESAKKNGKKTPKKRTSGTDSSGTTAKRPRGRPRKEHSENSGASITVQSARTQNDTTSSNIPSSSSNHYRQVNRDQTHLTAVHPHAVASPAGTDWCSRSSSPDFPELSVLFGNDRMTHAEASYDAAPVSGESQSMFAKANSHARRSSVTMAVTPSHGSIDNSERPRETQDASASRLGLRAADVIDLTSD